jgi:hypothetical protein
MVELSKRGRQLLKRLCAGETLTEIRCHWSSWYIEKGSSRRQVIGWVAGELNAHGLVERIDDRASIHSLGALYEFYRHSVTDAGRAYVAALNAPQELT